jgi:hypothetical protein
MKKRNAGIGMLLGGLIVLTLSAQDITTTRENPTVVVGTFDSRGVLFAYVGSDEFDHYLSAQKTDVGRALERAKAAGDEKLVAKLDALGPAMQKRIHEQGFGTAPVDDIIARIEDKLPGIAKKAGVDVIVSKWTLTYSGPAAKFVDVTDLLVAEFDPSEETLQGIREIVAQEPVPLDQLTEDH